MGQLPAGRQQRNPRRRECRILFVAANPGNRATPERHPPRWPQPRLARLRSHRANDPKVWTRKRWADHRP